MCPWFSAKITETKRGLTLGRDPSGESERLHGQASPPAEEKSHTTRSGEENLDLAGERVQVDKNMTEKLAASLIEAGARAEKEAELLLQMTGHAAVSVVAAPAQGLLVDVLAVSVYTEHRVLSAAHQRLDVYHPREAEIARTAQMLAASGKSEEEIARWAVQERNHLRKELRERGDPLVDSLASLSRGDDDMPTYERLRQTGKSDAEIIASATRSNASVDRWAVTAETVASSVDVALQLLDEVIEKTAPAENQPASDSQKAREEEAIRGGQAGEAEGAALGEELFAHVGVGQKLGASLGSVIGGVTGAITRYHTKG
jgi:hypothetical protein